MPSANINPYTRKSNRPTVATELRLHGSNEPFVGANGEFNASSKNEILAHMKGLLDVTTNGQRVETVDVAAHREEVVNSHREMIMAAFTDPDAYQEVGEILANEIYIAANREGFMRRFLPKASVVKGSIPMARVRMKNQIATVASAPVQVKSQLARDRFFFPPEFYITARPFVEQREIQQSADDVLEEKFVEGVEGVMVAEDRTFYQMSKASISDVNPLTTISGSLTPASLSAVRTNVLSYGIPATGLLIATDLWNDIIGDANFAQVFDPVTKHDLIQTGQVGTLYGMTVYTDAYRMPEHKVLSQGDILVYGASVNLGQYTDRGGVTSQPTDTAIEGVPGRGWVLTELVSLIIGNPRAVAIAKRV